MLKASGDASLDCRHGVGCVEEVARHETRSTVRRGGPWHRRGVARHRTAMSCGAGAVCRGSMDARDSETQHRLYVRGTEEASDCNGLRCWSVLRGRSVAELTDCTVFAAGKCLVASASDAVLHCVELRWRHRNAATTRAASSGWMECTPSAVGTADSQLAASRMWRRRERGIDCTAVARTRHRTALSCGAG